MISPLPFSFIFPAFTPLTHSNENDNISKGFHVQAQFQKRPAIGSTLQYVLKKTSHFGGFGYF